MKGAVRDISADGEYWWKRQGWLQNTSFNNRFKCFLPYSDPPNADQLSIQLQQDRLNHLISQLEWRKLNFIELVGFDARKKMKFNFNEIFNNKRLNLKSIQLEGNQGDVIYMYSFEYDKFNELPNCLSKKFDKWGYYNGNDYSVKEFVWTVAQQYPPDDFFSDHDFSRRSNENYSKIGMLKKIIYPTKGYSLFEYETHKASRKVTNNGGLLTFDPNLTIGGVRIKKVEKYNHNYPKETISYEYEPGVLMYDFTSFIPNWKGGNGAGETYVFNLNGLHNLSNFSGSHIAYPKVTERFSNNSSIDYTYTGYNDFPDTVEGTLSEEQSIFNKKSDKTLLRGRLIEVLKKDSSGNTKEKKTMEYLGSSENTTRYVKAFNYTKPSLCPEYGLTYGNAYKLYYMDIGIIKETTQLFLKNKVIESIVNLKYNNDFLISEVSKINSEKKEVKINYTYISDIPKPWPQPANNSAYQRLLQVMHYDKNMIDYPFEETQRVNGKVIESKLFNYTLFDNNVINVSSIETLKKDPNLPFVKAHFPNNNNVVPLTKDPDYKTNITFHKYEDQGNIIEISKENDIRVVYFWGYNKTLLIAKIENASYQNIQTVLNMSENQLLNLNESNMGVLNSLRISLPKSTITTYTHNPIKGLTSITDSRGEIIYYEYDNFNRLKFIKDANNNIIKENKYNYKK